MKRIAALLLLSSLCTMADAPKRSGHATAQWLVVGGPVITVENRATFHTVVRLVIDDPWHVYWYNPGEAGMETSVELKLPEGWKGSGLMHPVPKRFKTGGLHGFGHEGTVDYRLTLLAPENFKGDAELQATVSWLSCNDDACIPGEMMLKLKVEQGKVVGPKVDREVHRRESPKYPVLVTMMQQKDGVELDFKDGGKHWELTIKRPDQMGLDPDKTEVFVETQELVPASADVKFKEQGELWVAQFPKGEFAPQKPDRCAVVLAQKGKQAQRLLWMPGLLKP